MKYNNNILVYLTKDQSFKKDSKDSIPDTRVTLLCSFSLSISPPSLSLNLSSLAPSSPMAETRVEISDHVGGEVSLTDSEVCSSDLCYSFVATVFHLI